MNFAPSTLVSVTLAVVVTVGFDAVALVSALTVRRVSSVFGNFTRGSAPVGSVSVSVTGLPAPAASEIGLAGASVTGPAELREAGKLDIREIDCAGVGDAVGIGNRLARQDRVGEARRLNVQAERAREHRKLRCIAILVGDRERELGWHAAKRRAKGAEAIQPTTGTAPPTAVGGRPAALYEFMARSLVVTNAFAAFRPPSPYPSPAPSARPPSPARA